MKLDPCPWCGRQPRVSYFFYRKEEMVGVSCCHANLICAKIDAEEMWNWIDDFRLRSGWTTRQSNQDSLSILYTEREDEDTDKHYRD